MKIQFENFNIILIFLSIFGFPVFVTLSLIFGFNTSDGSIFYRFLVVFFSLLVILLQIKKLPKLKLNALTLFFILYSVRIVYDLSLKGITTSYIETSKIYLFYFGGIILPAIAISFMNINFNKLNQLIFHISLIQCFFVAYGLYLLYGFDILSLLSDRYLFTSSEINDGNGSPLNPILVSRSGATLFALLFVNILFNKVKLKSIVSLISFILSFSLILLGGSRGPLIACVLILIFSLFYYYKESINKNIIYGFLIFLLMYFGINYLINNYSESIGLVTRINDSLLNSSGFTFGREEHFKSAFNQFLNNPIIGDKIFDNHSNFYPHNLFLEAFMALGLFGGSLFLLFIFHKLIYFSEKKSFINLYILFSMFTLFSCTSGAIWNSIEFWIIAFVVGQKSFYDSKKKYL